MQLHVYGVNPNKNIKTNFILKWEKLQMNVERWFGTLAFGTGGLAHKQRPRSFESWRRWIIARCLLELMMSPPKVECKRKHVTALGSPLIKTVDRSVKTLGREL